MSRHEEQLDFHEDQEIPLFWNPNGPLLVHRCVDDEIVNSKPVSRVHLVGILAGGFAFRKNRKNATFHF